MEETPTPQREDESYVTIGNTIEEGTFDGYALKIVDSATGNVVHIASGEVHTLEGLRTIAQSASEYRPGETYSSLMLSNSRTGETRHVTLESLTDPMLLVVPEEVVSNGADGYSIDFIDADGTIEPGGRGELSGAGGAELDNVRIIAEAGSKYAAASGKRMNLRVYNSRTGHEADVRIVAER